VYYSHRSIPSTDDRATRRSSLDDIGAWLCSHKECQTVLHFLPPLIRGSLATVLLVANLIFWATPFFGITFAKLLVPLPAWRRKCARTLVRLAEHWIDGNNRALGLIQKTTLETYGLDELRPDHWYLIDCNHQSTVDILVLQRVFNHRIPFLKFFLKQELIWVPILGLAWWALDYPFMKRYSKAELERRPELRGKDLETTRKACERFKDTPSTILNFLEGTRFTAEKHARQASPYRHLLRPKAGGVAFVMAAMGERFNSLLDVTIVYPGSKHKGMWDFVSGQISRIIVHVREIPIPPELLDGNYADDPQFQERFQAWVRDLWATKDALIEQLLGHSNQTPAALLI